MTLDNLKSLKCAIYARVSTTGQADIAMSISDQEAQGKRHIGERDGEYVGTYVEAGASAKTMARPVYQAMLADAHAGRIDVVVTFTLSRLFHNAQDFL